MEIEIGTLKYEYIQNAINNNMYDEGYADLRATDYYVVPSCKYKWNKVKGKGEIPKVEKGIRNKKLWLDACHFIKTTPNITKEHLVYCLIRVVLEHYDNKDKELTNQYIRRKAKEAWNGTDKVGTTKKRFKIDKSYWLQRGENDWLKVTHTVQKKMKDKDFSSLFDFNLSLEQNLKVFHGWKKKVMIILLIKNSEINLLLNNTIIIRTYRIERLK